MSLILDDVNTFTTHIDPAIEALVCDRAFGFEDIQVLYSLGDSTDASLHSVHLFKIINVTMGVDLLDDIFYSVRQGGRYSDEPRVVPAIKRSMVCMETMHVDLNRLKQS